MQQMNSGHIDLIYLDPPFNSNHNYAAPIGSEAAGAEFKDTWTLQDVDEVWHGYLADKHSALYSLIQATGEVSGDSMKSYLIYMAMRILEMKRLLKSTGSIYLHCDPTAGHYLKLTMDAIFGRQNFRNELIWHYGKMSNTRKNFPRNHDILLRYTKSGSFIFNPQKSEDSEYRNRYINFLTGNQVLYGSVKHKKDKLITGRIRKVEKHLGRTLRDNDVLFDFDREFKHQSDVIYVPIIKGNAKERVDYPTQKPIALLHKIILASSNEDDVVFDPFCGCSTTLIAAQELRRNWVGIDISPKAGELIKFRIESQLFLYYEGKVTDELPKRSPKDRTDDELFPDTKRLPYNHPTIKQLLFGRQEERCNGCHEVFRFKTFEVDHITPRSKDGSNDISNLQLLCPNCNRRKGNRSMKEFGEEMFREKKKEMERSQEEFERAQRHYQRWEGRQP